MSRTQINSSLLNLTSTPVSQIALGGPNVASTGTVLLANADNIAWRNVANNADLYLTVDSSNRLNYNSGIWTVDTGGNVISSGNMTINGGTFETLTAGNGMFKVTTSGNVVTFLGRNSTDSVYTSNIYDATQHIIKIQGTEAWRSDTNGNISFTNTGNNNGILGVINGGNAAIGNVGEYVSSIASSVNFPTSGTWASVTSISLTAGDWDVCCWITANVNAVSVTALQMGINTSNSQPGNPNGITMYSGSSTTNIYSGSIPRVRFSVATLTTVYLILEADYSGTIPQANGQISARRVR